MCVAIIGRDPAEMIHKAEAVVRDNPFVEFRLDYLRQPGQAIQRVRHFLEYHPEVVAIGTCRRSRNGGKFRGSVAAQVGILIKAGDAGCQMVDLELQSAERLRPAEFQRLRGHAAAVILSFHDFKATRKLEETFRKMVAFSADFFKLVSTANRLFDNVVMMKFLQEQNQRHSMVGLCMGEQGLISRVLGLRAGSVFTFAAAT